MGKGKKKKGKFERIPLFGSSEKRTKKMAKKKILSALEFSPLVSHVLLLNTVIIFSHLPSLSRRNSEEKERKFIFAVFFFGETGGPKRFCSFTYHRKILTVRNYPPKK